MFYHTRFRFNKWDSLETLRLLIKISMTMIPTLHML